MYEVFFRKFREKVPLTPDEEKQIIQYLIPKKLRKKQYLLQQGDVCKAIVFVEKGALRAYSVDDKGHEYIIQFALEGWTISDHYSFLTSEPATYNIDAIKNCELILISTSAQKLLLKEVPKYETYTRLQITGAYIAMQKRITSIISLPAEDRYKNLIAMYPTIIQRVPRNMIAS